MRGAGIRPVDMSAERGILLDISRLVSRLGGGPLTGIDRVEMEWLVHLQGRPHLLLCRVPRGQVLLPPDAGAALLRWIGGELDSLPPAGLLARMSGRHGLGHRAIRALRRMALARQSGFIDRLGARAQRELGKDAVYLNLGHANWLREVFAGLSELKRVVMVHDVIPLDHPEFTRQGQSEKFRDRFAVAIGMADQVLTISEASRSRIEFWRARLGVRRRVPIEVTPIGTRPVRPDMRELPTDLDLKRPFFICLGTIEPRKNHTLLLDAWQRLAQDLPSDRLPQLVIIGRRGWENREVFERLDQLPQTGPVREYGDLDDGAVAALMTRAHALLMPSRAEGFGLPLTEAARLGLPVLAAPLPSTRELLGDWARYLDPDDPEVWAKEIVKMARGSAYRLPILEVPDWPGHFSAVRRALMELRD